MQWGANWRFSAEKWHDLPNFKRIPMATVLRMHHSGWGWKQGKRLLQKSRWEMTMSWGRVLTVRWLVRSDGILYIFYKLSQQNFLTNWVWDVKKWEESRMMPKFLTPDTGTPLMLMPLPKLHFYTRLAMIILTMFLY